MSGYNVWSDWGGASLIASFVDITFARNAIFPPETLGSDCVRSQKNICILSDCLERANTFIFLSQKCLVIVYGVTGCLFAGGVHEIINTSMT